MNRIQGRVGAYLLQYAAQGEMVELAKTALEKARYEVRVITTQEARSYPGPVIHVKSNSLLTKCGVTGISMCQLRGAPAWFSRFRPPTGVRSTGRSWLRKERKSCWFGWCAGAFETAMAQSLTNIMNQFIEWTSDSSFRASLVQATARQDMNPSP